MKLIAQMNQGYHFRSVILFLSSPIICKLSMDVLHADPCQLYSFLCSSRAISFMSLCIIFAHWHDHNIVLRNLDLSSLTSRRCEPASQHHDLLLSYVDFGFIIINNVRTFNETVQKVKFTGVFSRHKILPSQRTLITKNSSDTFLADKLL